MAFLLDDTEVNRPAYGDLEAPLGNSPGLRGMRKARSTRRQQELELLRCLQDLERNAEIGDLVQASQQFPLAAPQSRKGSRKKYNQTRPDRYRFLTLILQQTHISKP